MELIFWNSPFVLGQFAFWINLIYPYIHLISRVIATSMPEVASLTMWAKISTTAMLSINILPWTWKSPVIVYVPLLYCHLNLMLLSKDVEDACMELEEQQDQQLMDVSPWSYTTVPFRPTVQSRVTSARELNTWGVSSRVTGRREHLIRLIYL